MGIGVLTPACIGSVALLATEGTFELGSTTCIKCMIFTSSSSSAMRPWTSWTSSLIGVPVEAFP